MKKMPYSMPYFLASMLLVMAFIYSKEMLRKIGSPVMPMELLERNEEIMPITGGGSSQPDRSMSTGEDQPQLTGEPAAAPDPSEDILVQQPEAFPPSEKTTTSIPKSGIPVLMYHSISTDEKNSLCVSEEQFREEMEWLYNNGYQTMSIDEFYEALLNQGPVPEKPVLITFDDGYTDNYTSAWPILQQYGFTATFFIITDSVSPSRMDFEQLMELIEQGNSIGSHTIHHYDLSTLSLAQQKKEIADSKSILEENLDIEVKAFCYPSGKYNQTTLKLLSESGYSLGFSTKSGRVHADDDPLLLKRVRIWGGMTFSQFKKLIAQTQ